MTFATSLAARERNGSLSNQPVDPEEAARIDDIATRLFYRRNHHTETPVYDSFPRANENDALAPEAAEAILAPAGWKRAALLKKGKRDDDFVVFRRESSIAEIKARAQKTNDKTDPEAEVAEQSLAQDAIDAYGDDPVVSSVADYPDDCPDDETFSQNALSGKKSDDESAASPAAAVVSENSSSLVLGKSQNGDGGFRQDGNVFSQNLASGKKSDDESAASPAAARTSENSSSLVLGESQNGDGGAPVSVSDMLAFMAMRDGLGDAFCCAYDSEYYYDEFCRRLLSWQLAYAKPGAADVIVEEVITPRRGKLLSFGSMLGNAILSSGAYKALAKRLKDKDGNEIEHTKEGVSYYKYRRWRVPVSDGKGGEMPKNFRTKKSAIANCKDPELKALLEKYGDKLVKMRKAGVGGGVVFERSFRGYPVGYFIDYKNALKEALTVCLLCHCAQADITAFMFDDPDIMVDEVGYALDLPPHLSQIQGGALTLKAVLAFVRVPDNRKRFYPVILFVRDTMAYAPDGKRSLAALGKAIKVSKVELPEQYDKSRMDIFYNGDRRDFYEYASTDSVVTLLYASNLWGFNKRMPATVPSAAAKAGRVIMMRYLSEGLGYEIDIKEFNRIFRGLVPEDKGLSPVRRGDGVLGFTRRTALVPVSEAASRYMTASAMTYHGGINQCYRVVKSDILTVDIDMQSAYALGMGLTPDINWEGPFKIVNGVSVRPENARKFIDEHHLGPVTPLVACVDFEFPKSVFQPCFPVMSGSCMTFPWDNKGLSHMYVTGPELYLALRLGASVHIHSMIVPSLLEFPDGRTSHALAEVSKAFVRDRETAKKVFGKDSLEQLLLKMSNNSSYGKVAQDVAPKKSWDAYNEQMAEIGGSPITSPSHAAMITAIVRCAIIAAINQAEGMGYEVYSVTTDGFILKGVPMEPVASGAPEGLAAAKERAAEATVEIVRSLDLFGLAPFLRKVRGDVTGGKDDSIWEKKHWQCDLLNLTTRGNASLEPDGVLAHNGWNPPKDIVKGSPGDREMFVNLCLTRTDKVRCRTLTFTGQRAWASRKGREDFRAVEAPRNISMDYDMKRCPIRSSLRPVYYVIDGKEYEFACVETRPYQNVAEFLAYRAAAKAVTCLRTCAEWEDFFDIAEDYCAGINQPSADSRKGRRRIRNVKWRRFVSALAAYRLGLPLKAYGNRPVPISILQRRGLPLAVRLEWLNEEFLPEGVKKKVTKSVWENAGRTDRQNSILPESEWIDIYMKMVDAGRPIEGGNVRRALAEAKLLLPDTSAETETDEMGVCDFMDEMMCELDEAWFEGEGVPVGSVAEAIAAVNEMPCPVVYS